MHPAAKGTMAEVMTPSPHTVASTHKLSFAHKLMDEHGVRHLPVLRHGKLVGVLSQRDLFLLESMAGVDVEIDTIADAMTSDVYTTTPEASVGEVASAMANHKYGCAVVMKSDHVVGVFTVTDALRHLARVLE